MLYRTRFENEMTSLLEFETPPSGSAPLTHYQALDLNTRLRGKKMGVHVPPAAAKAKKVDVIVYFHGVINVCGDEAAYIAKGVEYLWSTPPFDKMRSELDNSNRAAVLVVPRLDSRVGQKGTGTSHFGDLHRDNAFDLLVNTAINGLRAIPAVREDVEIGNIVLAAHSGGGSPMSAILGAKNDLRPSIRACWGFECLYPGHLAWLNWLKEDPGFRFRHFRQECVFTTEAGKLRTGVGSARFVDTLTFIAKNAHCNLIKDFWKTAIHHMPLSPGTSTPY